jgi:hypothetical protein
MSRKTLGMFALWGFLSVGGYAVVASGQDWAAPPPASGGWMPAAGSSAGNCCVTPQITAQAICPPPQPLVTHVAVTEMRECRQTVQRPVVETQYVEQPVTEYHQVVEQKVAQVPTVSYQTVTECQTRTRDMGQWVTSYACRPQMDPCQYDGRPGLMGWMNRTGYQMRMAFTPQVIAQRNYVPNVVTESVPVTRQVAIPGTRQVAYQVSRMVPVTTTRKVAVNTVRMVAQEVVTKHPVTVMRQVNVGTASAFNSGAYYGTASAPVPDPISSARGYTTPLKREARNLKSLTNPDADAFDDSKDRTSDGDGELQKVPAKAPVKRTSFSAPVYEPSEEPAPAVEAEADATTAEVRHTHYAPSVVRVNQWVARRRPTTPNSTEESISVAKASTRGK